MAVLKNERSNLSTVLGAVRELEMAQRCVCVWKGGPECVPTSKFPPILLPLVIEVSSLRVMLLHFVRFLATMAHKSA